MSAEFLNKVNQAVALMKGAPLTDLVGVLDTCAENGQEAEMQVHRDRWKAKHDALRLLMTVAGRDQQLEDFVRGDGRRVIDLPLTRWNARMKLSCPECRSKLELTDGRYTCAPCGADINVTVGVSAG